MTRRKLGSSLETNKLSAEEQALVDAALPKPKKPEVSTQASGESSAKIAGRITPNKTEMETAVESKKVEASEETPIKLPHDKPKRGRPKKVEQARHEEEKDVVLITDSFKLKKDVQERLLRASFERKLSKTSPYTKQAIVNEALESWLGAKGF